MALEDVFYDRHLAAHMAAATRMWRDHLRREHQVEHPGLADFERLFRRSAGVPEGQEGSRLDSVLDLPDGEPVHELLFTVGQVADRLGVSPSTVKRLIKSGELPSTKVGRARRVHRDALEAYATNQKGAAA